MLLDLNSIMEAPGASRDFACELDLSGMTVNFQRPAPDPVRVSGTVANDGGLVVLKARAQTTLHLVCDRCAAEFEREVSLPVERTLAENLSGDESEDVEPVQDGAVELDGIVESEFMLGAGMRTLCSEGCRGLCPACGQNLNEGTCGCVDREPDPRLEKLRGLLDNSE